MPSDAFVSPEEEGDVGVLGTVGDWGELDGGLMGRPMAVAGAVIL